MKTSNLDPATSGIEWEGQRPRCPFTPRALGRRGRQPSMTIAIAIPIPKHGGATASLPLSPAAIRTLWPVVFCAEDARDQPSAASAERTSSISGWAESGAPRARVSHTSGVTLPCEHIRSTSRASVRSVMCRRILCAITCPTV